jgi:hypothetical protein
MEIFIVRRAEQAEKGIYPKNGTPTDKRSHNYVRGVTMSL